MFLPQGTQGNAEKLSERAGSRLIYLNLMDGLVPIQVDT
jgi:hypothetical protein